MRGNHIIKLGYDFNHVLDGIDSIYNGNGSYDYSSLLDFASDALAPSRCDANGSGLGTSPCYSYYTQQLGPQVFSFDTNDYAVFLSDEWKVKHRLTLSYGLRYEYEQLPPQNKLLPNPALPQTHFIPSDRNNYGPRVGAAYDLTGHGNTVLRGGYGIYFGRIINSTIFAAYTQTGSPAGQLGYYFRPGDAGAPTFPYIFSGRAVVPEKPTADYFDPNFQNPRIAQAEVSLAQRISRNTEVTVSYLRSTGQYLPNFMDTNIDLTTAVPITYTVKDPLHQGPLKQSTYSTHLFTQRLNPATALSPTSTAWWLALPGDGGQGRAQRRTLAAPERQLYLRACAGQQSKRDHLHRRQRRARSHRSEPRIRRLELRRPPARHPGFVLRVRGRPTAGSALWPTATRSRPPPVHRLDFRTPCAPAAPSRISATSTSSGRRKNSPASPAASTAQAAPPGSPR